MSFFRLLQSSLMIAVLIIAVAASLAAQSSPEQTVVSKIPSSSADSSQSVANDPATHVPLFYGDESSHGIGLCLKMRSYKMARDNPQSDSTHQVGYSTCVPTTRFQTYKIERPAHIVTP
ncbi:MAG: hypothetical protein ABSF97_14430 [Candidatus Sulfotelmatobacter sp.]|jgi:hypothetical protein